MYTNFRVVIPNIMKGPKLPMAPLKRRQYQQSSAGNGPYQTLNKSNPMTTDE